jgi:hypothetical protein
MSVVEEQTVLRDSAQIAEPSLRRLYEYWLGKKGESRLPARRNIDPLDFPYALGRIMLVDVLGDPLRFRVRLHGSEMVRRAGYDLTGKTLDDLPDSEYRSYVVGRCKNLIASAEPALVHHDRVLDNRTWRYDAIWLPFSDDGTTVAMLLCALIYRKLPQSEPLS